MDKTGFQETSPFLLSSFILRVMELFLAYKSTRAFSPRKGRSRSPQSDTSSSRDRRSPPRRKGEEERKKNREKGVLSPRRKNRSPADRSASPRGPAAKRRDSFLNDSEDVSDVKDSVGDSKGNMGETTPGKAPKHDRSRGNSNGKHVMVTSSACSSGNRRATPAQQDSYHPAVHPRQRLLGDDGGRAQGEKDEEGKKEWEEPTTRRGKKVRGACKDAEISRKLTMAPQAARSDSAGPMDASNASTGDWSPTRLLTALLSPLSSTDSSEGDKNKDRKEPKEQDSSFELDKIFLVSHPIRSPLKLRGERSSCARDKGTSYLPS